MMGFGVAWGCVEGSWSPYRHFLTLLGAIVEAKSNGYGRLHCKMMVFAIFSKPGGGLWVRGGSGVTCDGFWGCLGLCAR